MLYFPHGIIVNCILLHLHYCVSVKLAANFISSMVTAPIFVPQ